MRAFHSIAQHFAVLLVAISAASTVEAGRPLVTDDAGLVEPGACQIEAWSMGHSGRTEYGIAPACNLAGNLELALLGVRGLGGGSPETTISVQGKTALRPLQPDDWGLGLVFGLSRQVSGGDGRSLYAYLPASLSLRGDSLLLHANLGLAYEAKLRQREWTWGVAGEIRLGERNQVVAEFFGNDQGGAYRQIGFRHVLLADELQFDIGFGEPLEQGSSGSWWTAGLTWLFPAR